MLTACLELDVFNLDVVLPIDIILVPQAPNNKHGMKIIKAGNGGGNIESPEPGIVRRSWMSRTAKTILRETPLKPFKFMFVTFPVWSPKWCTILNDWSNKNNKQFLHGDWIIRTNSPPNKSKQTFSIAGDLVNMGAQFKIAGQHNPKVFMGRNCFKMSITHVIADKNGTMRSYDVHDPTFGGIERKFVDGIPVSFSIQIGL